MTDWHVCRISPY